MELAIRYTERHGSPVYIENYSRGGYMLRKATNDIPIWFGPGDKERLLANDENLR